jgi:hypothetical protein
LGKVLRPLISRRPADGSLTPVADPLAPFITLDDIRPRLAALLGAASAPPPEA